jgi:hypothetical protein
MFFLFFNLSINKFVDLVNYWRPCYIDPPPQDFTYLYPYHNSPTPQNFALDPPLLGKKNNIRLNAHGSLLRQLYSDAYDGKI